MRYSALALDTKRTSENETSSIVRSLGALDYRSKEPIDQSGLSTNLVGRRNLNITATPNKAMRRNRPISEKPITKRTIYLNEALALLFNYILYFFPKTTDAVKSNSDVFDEKDEFYYKSFGPLRVKRFITHVLVVL